MSVVYLTTPGTSVRRRGDLLQVWQGDARVADLRLFELERLVILGSVQLSTQALGLLLDKGVDVALMTSRGRLRGTLISSESRNVFLRLAQFERWKDEPFRLAFSRQVTAAKLTAQARILKRYERNHPGALEPEAVQRLQQCLDKLEDVENIEALRGLEGTGASAYYSQFGKMLRHVSFPGRKKYPSTDPVNALLSLGYVLLTNEIAAELVAKGFDPAIGFFHGLRYGRKSLSLDVVEPFRQPVIDRLTLRLFNRKQFTPADFEGGERGLRLSSEGLKVYLGHYEEQLRAPSEGQDSPDWRRRIRRQVAALRQMVMSGQAAAFDTWGG